MPIVVIPNNTSPYLLLTVLAAVSYPEPPSQGILYTASNGDRWDNIAYAMYGDPTQVEELIQNNPAVPVGDYVATGTQLFVPLIEVSTTSSPTTPWG